MTAVVILAVAAVVAVVRFAGRSGRPAPAAATSSAAPSATPSDATSATTSAVAVTRHATPVVRAAPICRASALAVSIPADSIAGSMPGTVGAIRFRNTGRSACSLAGYPSVVVTGTSVALRPTYSRSPVTAAWGPFPAVRLTVPAGGEVESALLIATPTRQECDPAPAFTWHVAAPGSRTRVELPGSRFVTVCPSATQILVSPVHRPQA